ncbi:amidase family protein [Spiroplasma endosymbiont of Nebria brevicollis]|uniref:amidase family protein n=1 Tax=Spiroplasma endosymbiont of Nebria brevicollis TaxID=3066284 RepID=UPI00313D90E3
MKINYHQLSIRQLHEMLMNEVITPIQLVTSVYKRLEKWKNLNGVVTSLAPQAIKHAKELTQTSMDKSNLLMGIPFVMKDNIATIDNLTTGSSKILANFIPNYDSTVNKYLTKANAINIAKTALDELGMGGDGLYAATGHVLNPWNPEHITGGSSSGSAALVAAGIVPFALGTDTGDSIRKPAAYCGITGFKPTYGLISRNGVFPYAPSLDTVGVFTNHVEDVAIVLDNLVHHDIKDFTSVHSMKKDYVKNLNPNMQNKNIAILNYDSYQWTPDIKQAFDDAVNNLITDGAKINKINFDEQLLQALLPVYMIISFAEATSCHANLTGINFGIREAGADYSQVMTNSRTAGFGDMVKRRYIIGAYALSASHQEELFNKAKKVRRLVVEALTQIFKKYDAFIVMPTITSAPTIKDVLEQKKVISPKHDYLEDLLLLSNLNGGPSITIPLTTVNNLPIGININAAPFDDQTALDIAQFLSNYINFNNKMLGDENE